MKDKSIAHKFFEGMSKRQKNQFREAIDKLYQAIQGKNEKVGKAYEKFLSEWRGYVQEDKKTEFTFRQAYSQGLIDSHLP